MHEYNSLLHCNESHVNQLHPSIEEQSIDF